MHEIMRLRPLHGIVEVPKWRADTFSRYRWNNGVFESRPSLEHEWIKTRQDPEYWSSDFAEFVLDHCKSLLEKQEPPESIDDNDIELACNYATLQQAIQGIKNELSGDRNISEIKAIIDLSLIHI